MNQYEAKQAAKKAYYADKADKLRLQAQDLFSFDCQEMSHIPPGQPILVGHHSERGHRAALHRSWGRLDKIKALNEKAAHYEHKATAQSNAISSDDEDAISKLTTKLQQLEALQVKMKQVNKAYAKEGVEAIKALPEADQKAILTNFRVCPYEKLPYPRYELTNNSANIRRVKQRIAALEAAQQRAPSEPIARQGYTITENPEDNRLWVSFDQKPAKAVCEVMRRHGFRWSPSRMAWVRMLKSGIRSFAVSCIMSELEPLLSA